MPYKLQDVMLLLRNKDARIAELEVGLEGALDQISLYRDRALHNDLQKIMEQRITRARIAELEAEVKRKDDVLVGIEEYWNGEPSDGAMLDALDVIVARARAALGREG